MSNIIFLASSRALKPKILISSFNDSCNKENNQYILLTDDYEGNVVEFARNEGMKIIVSEDSRFMDNEWIEDNLCQYRDYILVSCGWPYKIPNFLINYFRSAINCHGSYLPDYRGSRAYMHYWANCSSFFGATIHFLTDKFDDGNIIIRAKQSLFMNENQNTVFVRTAELCGILLAAAIPLVEQHYSGFKVKDKARYFFKMSPEEFEEHRKKNEALIESDREPVLTRHKLV